MQDTRVNMSKLFPMTISAHNRRGGAILATFLAALSFVSNVYAADALDITPFNKKIPITVSGYTGTETLENFPVLVTFSTGSPTVSRTSVAAAVSMAAVPTRRVRSRTCLPSRRLTRWVRVSDNVIIYSRDSATIITAANTADSG